jgi:hypothetical protein
MSDEDFTLTIDQELTGDPLVSELKDIEDEFVSAQDQLEGTAKGFKKLGGPLGKAGNMVEDLSEGWGKLSDSLGSTGAIAAVGVAGLALLAAAVVAVGVAAVAAAAKIAQWAISLADARREQELTIEGIQIADGALTNLSSTIDDVQRTTGQQTTRLLDLTQQLRKAGITADQLPAALEAISKADVGNPQGTAELISGLKDGKKSYADLLAEGSKFTDVVSKKQLGLSSQWERFQRNISDIFGGANIEGFLTGLSRIVDLFDKNTASGQALKAIFETLFGPLEGADDVFVMIERGFLLVEIAALKAGIQIKEMAKGIDTKALGEMWDLLSPVVLDGMSAALSIYVAGWVLFIQALVWVTNVFTTAWNAGKALGEVIAQLAKGDFSFIDKFKSIGSDIIDGLVQSILAGATKVASAVTSVATTAVDTAKNVLKSHSPSEVFYDIGASVPEGMAGGVDAGASDVKQSLESMVEPPDVPSGKGGKGQAPTVVNVTFNGVQGAEDALDRFEALVDRLIRGGVRETGGEAPAT